MKSWPKVTLGKVGVGLIDWMFYDHLSAHSLLAKLGRWGWLMRMRLAWKKSQKTLDTSKRLHQNKTLSTGSAGKGLNLNFAIIGTADSGKVQVHHTWRHLAGGETFLLGGAYNRVFNCGPPPPPRPKVSKVFEPKRVNSLLLPW